MHVTALGAGTVLSCANRNPSGYPAEFAGERLLPDMGAETLALLHSEDVPDLIVARGGTAAVLS